MMTKEQLIVLMLVVCGQCLMVLAEMSLFNQKQYA